MKTVQIKLYTFGELDEKAKQAALTDNMEINVGYNWWDTLYLDAEEAGLKINGFDLDYKNDIKAEFTLDAVYTAGKITDNHGSTTATFLTTADFWEHRDKLLTGWPRDADRVYLRADELAIAVDKLEAAYLNAIAKDYFRLLAMEYDYLTSDEGIAETLTANEYSFTADGKMATRIERMAEPLSTTN